MSQFLHDGVSTYIKQVYKSEGSARILYLVWGLFIGKWMVKVAGKKSDKDKIYLCRSIQIAKRISGKEITRSTENLSL